MSTNSIQDLLSESLPDAIESSNLALTHIKISFLIGVGVFIILAYFCKSRKSYFDAVAARKVISFARLFIFVELLCIFILYYFYFEHGPLMDLHQYLGKLYLWHQLYHHSNLHMISLQDMVMVIVGSIRMVVLRQVPHFYKLVVIFV